MLDRSKPPEPDRPLGPRLRVFSFTGGVLIGPPVERPLPPPLPLPAPGFPPRNCPRVPLASFPAARSSGTTRSCGHGLKRSAVIDGDPATASPGALVAADQNEEEI